MKRNRKYHIITIVLFVFLVLSLFSGEEIIENNMITMVYIFILMYHYYKFIDIAIALIESDYKDTNIVFSLSLFGLYTYGIVHMAIEYINYTNIVFSIYLLTLNFIYVILNNILFEEEK